MIESYETEELIKLISKKKDYWAKVENPQQAKYLQKEILFLENSILPIVLRNTQILHKEVADWAVNCFEETIKSEHADKINGILLYLHFNDNGNFLKIPVFSSVSDVVVSAIYIKDMFAVTKPLKELELWMAKK